MDFPGAKEYILHRLHELNPLLYYHSIFHTLDVYEASSRLAKMEGITGSKLVLIQTAALFHDSGILRQYIDHERVSASLAHETLPKFGYTKNDVDEVSGLIIQTKLPQQATTLPAQILCDADLDYLGREDFFIHSFQLQLEWKLFDVKTTNLKEWLVIQSKFLTSHQYFTKSANQLRNKMKAEHLAEINNYLNSNS
ncbi:MAG: HD domain-containing protein [Bacteroidales bacterium]|nr:HD domain-containing protein [Bacteroidales bacterium]